MFADAEQLLKNRFSDPTEKAGGRYLTLLLTIFWQFCSLSATFILIARGIVESQVYKFSKILFFYFFFQLRLKQILNLKYQSQKYFEHYIMSVNKGT